MFKRQGLSQDFACFAEWLRILRSGKPPIELALPWVTLPATRFLMKVVHPGMKIFEWGCGGSTLFYASRGCDVIAIEHSQPWSDLVNEKLSSLQYRKCRVQYIPPEETDFPNQQDNPQQLPVSYLSTNVEFAGRTFVSYVRAIDSAPDHFYDVIAIDGRARSSCLFHAIKKVKQGGYILLDNSERDEYREGMALIPEGWTRMDFVGPIVSGQSFGCTTVWQSKP
ncbi:MAG: hypothetical protein RLZZ399_485 [Verrucomicrobiota bacterium]